MRVTLLLCDAAQAVGGKLYVLGGGWSIAGPGPVTMALALKIEVPWDQANRIHDLRLALVDADGKPVMVPTQEGERPVEFKAKFEVGRPPGLRPGTPLDYVLALNMESLPVPPGGRYEWRLEIDGHSEEGWRVGFSTRPWQADAR